MEKKIICILVSMLMCATIFSVTGAKNEVNTIVLERSQKFVPNLAPWDLLAAIDIGATGSSGANGNAGGEFDGTHLYSTRWASNLIHQYDNTGSLVKEFSIAGVSGLRDLAYNEGTGYFYGGAAAGTIWEMDFDSETLINTLSGSFQSRAIGYNIDDDVIYCSNWGDPVWVVDPATGSIVSQFNLVSATSTYGFAYDPDTAGPYLWVWDQGAGAGSPQYIHQWDLTAGAMTGFTYDVSPDVGSHAGIAGGLWLSPDYEPGTMCIGGTYQDGDAPGVTDWIVVYELYITNLPPLTPDAPDGPDNGLKDVLYTFTATTTDPEGDPIEYWFEWGDGENSGWVSPGSAQHAWTAAGTYDVTVKARDAVHLGESDFSPAHQITIVAGPVLEIQQIKGGLFKIKTIVKNVGATEATNVDYTITLDGGSWINLESTGTIPSIPAGGSQEIKSKLLIGFGDFYVTVTATIPEMSDTRTQHGKMLFIYAKVNPGGG